MRRGIWWLLLVFLFVAVAPVEVAFPQGVRQSVGGMGLLEPAWSPILLLPGTVTYPPVDTPNALCLADVDGDKTKELLAGGDYIHVLSVHGGKPSKNYLTVRVGKSRYVEPQGEKLDVVAMASGDIDGDGLDDLVVVTQSGELWLFKNQGQQGFKWTAGSPYKVSANRVWLYDADGDGNLDLIVGAYPKIELFMGDGEGSIITPPVSPGTIEGHAQSRAAGVYRGQPGFFLITEKGLWFLPQGMLKWQKVMDDGGQYLVVADLNGDGVDDLAIGVGSSIRIHFGSGEGFSEPETLKVEQGYPMPWFFSGDFNGDGRTDLVVGRSTPGGFSVFYNMGQGKFLGPFSFSVSVPEMGGLPPLVQKGIVGDLTGDGSDDLVVVAGSYHLSFFLSQGPGRIRQPLPGSFLLGKRDINGDGLPDLLSSTVDGGVAALVSGGFGAFTAETLVGPSGEERSPYLARLGDVTGDGKEDLVVWEFAEDSYPSSKARISVWDLGSKKLLWSTPLGEEIRPLLILSDQTGDGVKDVVTAVGDKVILLRHSSRGQPIRKEIAWGGPVGPLALVHLQSGEAVAGFRVGKEAELLLLRRGRVKKTDVKLSIAPLDLVAADMDGDGNEDLITIGWAAQDGKPVMAVGVFWGDGQGGFRAQLFPLKGWPPLAMPFPYGGLVAADLNGDGKPELAAMRLPDQKGNPGGVVVIPWTETGPGKLSFLPGCAGTKLFALDVNGDGKAELVSAATGTPAQLCLTTWR